MKRQSAIHARILELAARPQGMHSSDIPDMKADKVLVRAEELVKTNRLIKVKVAFKRVTFFTDPEQAKTAQIAADLANAVKTQTEARKPNNASFTRDAEVVFTPKTKFTVCPGHKPRFEAIETPHVHGANQRGRVTSCD